MVSNDVAAWWLWCKAEEASSFEALIGRPVGTAAAAAFMKSSKLKLYCAELVETTAMEMIVRPGGKSAGTNP